MDKNLYIDASHPNETRVVLKSGENIEDYEYEGLKNNLIKNNIYLGKVSRIEPSLQAAFVDFGRKRHGFLSFNDIQSDYYQIPTEDKDELKKAEEKIREDVAIVTVASFITGIRPTPEDILYFVIYGANRLSNSQKKSLGLPIAKKLPQAQDPRTQPLIDLETLS